MLDWSQIAFFANYSRTAYHLPLTALAWGDPNAPSGFVARWNATAAAAPVPAQLGAIVQRIGPGPGANNITSIDPSARAPVHGRDRARLRRASEQRHARAAVRDGPTRAATARRCRQRCAGIELHALARRTIQASTWPALKDDQLLPIFNRPAATFGRDTYVLTNPADNEATLVGVDLNIQSHTDRLFYLFGATASRSEGLAGNRGFLATENDEGVLGDVFIDPNSRTFAQGRMFTERGYTIKTAGTYHFDHDVRLGVMARTRTASTSRVSFLRQT